ncbi:methyltransferase [Stenomitos frigidus]|uniref:Methyltransferase n=1 Tax=Stenomitos frigidus ULC18 TaxID=2107698 RepID=A0A2T1DY81_9CYAN|nr:methyltransferase [Stenomitos frigidus]PSB25435.1 methyltransferase [Stenomitos frigidus ULC18]
MVVAKSDPRKQADDRATSAPTMPPQVAMMQMANAYRVSQAIHVAAKLGIADVLSDGAKSIPVLAAATQTHPQALYRLLRALASMGIFAETETGEFALTPRAATLRSNVPGSLRDYAIVLGETWHWQTWGDILYSVQTGQPAFDHLYGMEFLDYLAQHPDLASAFDRSMVSLLETIDNGILAHYTFTKTIVEVGIPGGYGSLLARILKADSSLSGIFFDLAPGIALAQSLLTAQGVSDRCQLTTGDVFESLPQGGDVYILKNLIHDWDDDTAGKILQNCRKAMHETAKLLVVEMLIPPGNAPALSKIIDIEALIMSAGGYERTEAQYRSLFAIAGLTVTKVIATRSPFSLIEAVRTN